MTRRPGLTLMEVLVTLGILAFGILAILTLFPLAASQMAIAVREDRSAQAAAAADAYMRAYWKIEVVEKGGATEPFYAALSDPNSSGASPPHGQPALSAALNEPSYPVLIDPMGWVARLSPNQMWLGDAIATTNVPRRSLTLVGTNPQYCMRVCSLADGLGYDDDGLPVNPATGVTDREWRYNWAWVVQRPVNRNQFTANMTVIVFDKRAPLFAPPGSEAAHAATFTQSLTTVTVFDNASGPPDVKPGGWVMDATVTTAGVSGGTRNLRHANFYQIVSVSPGTVAGTTDLELQTPVKAPSDNNSAAYTGTLVVLKGVSGVYPRAPLASGE